MKARHLLLLGRALPLVPFTTFALGIRAPDQDAFAVARGNAFVATADNPSAIYYNPAGISQLDSFDVRSGLYAIYMKDEYRNAGVAYDTVDKLGVLPQMYATLPIKGVPLTVGLGIYCPYGLALEWPDEVPFAALGKSGSVQYTTFDPVLSWKITDTLSLGAGPTINYSQAKLTRNLPLPGPVREFQFKGDDVAFGANAGLLWKPHQKHSFGLSYHSPTTMDYSGHSTALGSSVEASTSLRYPQTVVGGYSFRPTPRWNFEFDVDWTDWDYLTTVYVHHPQSASAPFYSSIPMDFNWQSSFMFQWGATYYLGDGYTVSAGYIYSQNSVPDSAFNPTVPDSDRHVFSVGFGRKTKGLSWDIAYQFGYGPERAVPSSGVPSALVSGNYTFYSHALNLSVGYNF